MERPPQYKRAAGSECHHMASSWRVHPEPSAPDSDDDSIVEVPNAVPPVPVRDVLPVVVLNALPDEVLNACRRCCDRALPAVADALLRAAAGVRGGDGETMLDDPESSNWYLAGRITDLALEGLRRNLTWAVGEYKNRMYFPTLQAIRRFEACANSEPARLLCEEIRGDTRGSLLFRDERFTTEMIVRGLVAEFTRSMPALMFVRIRRHRTGQSSRQSSRWRCFGAQEEGGALLRLRTLDGALDGVLGGSGGVF